MDVRNPNNPIVVSPGGPIWEINDWLSYQQSLESVGAIWTDNDFLYFDETRDLWYYRITKSDLQGHGTLKDFLTPTRDLLLKNEEFKGIQIRQPDLLRRFGRLKAEIADRMNEPKRLKDLFH